MSQYIEDILLPHVTDAALREGYQAMASDADREIEAQEWCNALAGDMRDNARSVLMGRIWSLRRQRNSQDPSCCHRQQ